MKIIKRIVFVLLVLASLISFVGCGDISEMPDDEKVIKALDEAKICYSEGDTETSITKDLTFAFDGDNAFKIEWESSLTNIIDNNGKVTRPEKDTIVRITIKITLNDTTLQKSYNVVVKGIGEASTEFTVTFNGDGGVLTSGKELQKVASASEIVAPTYTKEGYTFDGWDKDLLTLSQDTTVKAKWVENKISDTTSFDDILNLDIEEGATSIEKYTVEGVIQVIDNTTFGNLKISDGQTSLYVYGLLDSDGKKYGEFLDKPVIGDTIVITGAVKNYNGNNELIDAVLVSFKKGQGSDTPITDEPKTIESTIGDILALVIEDKATTKDYYKVSGKITSIDNTTYGNVYITDGTNSLLIYGLYDKNGNRYDDFEYKPTIGDEITVYGVVKNYSGTIELSNAILDNVVKGQPISVDPLTISEVLKVTSGSIAKTSGTVIAKHSRGFLIQDNTGTILVYMNQNEFSCAIGDVVSVEGAITTYHNRNQFGESAVITKTGSVEYTNPSPSTLGANEVDALIQNPEMGKYVKVTGALTIDGTYYNVIIDGTEKLVALTYPQESFGLLLMNKKQIEVEGYILDVSTDGTRLNVLATSVKCLEELAGDGLPMTSDFMCSAKESKDLPDSWTWVKTSKGSYATLWQSFRANGDAIQSPVFKQEDGVKVTFKYYLNNSGTGTSQIKVTAYDVSGKEVSQVTSENIGSGDTGVENAKELTLNLTGTGISYIKIEFVKANGGNIGFSTIKIESLN